MNLQLEGNGPVEPAASRTIKYKHVVHGDVIYEIIFNEIFPYSTVGSVTMVTCKEPKCPWRSNMTSDLMQATLITLASKCILPVTAIMMASEAIAASM